MAGFNKINKFITTPVSKVTSIAVLAGCLVLGVLVGMLPAHSTTGSRNDTNLRNSRAQKASLLTPPVVPQSHKDQQQQKTSNEPKMPDRVLGTKFMNLNLALPTANEDESEGAEAGFVWGDQLPNLEGYDIDTLFATADAAEDFDAFESAEASFSFTFTETFTETFLSLSYEF